MRGRKWWTDALEFSSGLANSSPEGVACFFVVGEPPCTKENMKIHVVSLGFVFEANQKPGSRTERQTHFCVFF